MAEVNTKKKRGKRSKKATVEQVKAIMDAKPTTHEEMEVENQNESKIKTSETEVEKEKSIEKVYVVKTYNKNGEEKTVGFLIEEDEAKAFCKTNDKLENREGAYTYEALSVIETSGKKTKPYYQHQVRFMVRNELKESQRHFKYDGDMCIEPNNYIKYVGVKLSDDVLLFHNNYLTTLSVRTVQETRQAAESRAKEIYESYLMYYNMTGCYTKAHSLLLAKMGIKESEAALC